MRTPSILIPMILFLNASAPTVLAQSVSDVFNRVKDSVVVVRTTQKEISPYQKGETLSTAGLGSGVLIDGEAGLVVTAAHVVQTAETIEVEFTTGEIIPATVQASESSTDVALLKLEKAPTGAVVARLGDSTGVAVGDQIFIVGAPLGISHTLTVGHISARRFANQLFGGLSTAELFQTDAAVNHGNSGGPMFSMKGEVIGIVSSMVSRSGGYEGLGFVVTSNMTREALLERKTPWTGLEGFLLRGDLAKIFNLPQPVGVLVQRVARGSPAARMGLRAGTVTGIIGDETFLLGGDVILEVNGIKLSQPRGPETIRALLRQIEPGETIAITVLRGGVPTALVYAPFTE